MQILLFGKKKIECNTNFYEIMIQVVYTLGASVKNNLKVSCNWFNKPMIDPNMNMLFQNLCVGSLEGLVTNGNRNSLCQVLISWARIDDSNIVMLFSTFKEKSLNWIFIELHKTSQIISSKDKT